METPDKKEENPLKHKFRQTTRREGIYRPRRIVKYVEKHVGDTPLCTSGEGEGEPLALRSSLCAFLELRPPS